MTLSVSHRTMAEIRWTNCAGVVSMAYVSALPFRSASVLTFVYALGYPIGALAVSALSPMAVLVFRFGLAAAILGSWALVARVSWPTGVALVHVLHSGLLAQGVHGAATVSMLFCVIPAVAGLLAWMMLGQRPDVGIAVGLALGAMACWLNARPSSQQRQHDPARDGGREHRVDAVHHPAVAG